LENLTKLNIFYRVNLVSLPASQFPGDLRESVEQNLTNAGPLLANLDKGAGLPLSGFDIGVTHGRQVCIARLDSVQGAVFLLSLRTSDLIRKGDAEKAAESIISTLKLIRVFDVHPTVIVQGRKMICVGFACGDIQLLLTRCRPSQQRLEMLQSLLEETFRRDSLEKTLLAERVYQLEIARNLIGKKVASRYLTTDVPTLPERLALPELAWYRMRVFAGSLKYLQDMAWCLTASRRPWPEPLDTIMDINAAPSGKLSRLVPTVVPLAHLTAEMLAITRCTVAVIAIERYCLQQGRIPDSLVVLQPGYIESIPLDPFTGRPLLYSRDGDSYTVYSVGINRIDDKGKIASEPNEPIILDSGIRITRTATR
jgi:hypothetical protein